MMLSAWTKIPYTIFVCVLVSVYWVERGPANFVCLSDIALLVTLAALWLESRFLASMMAVGVLLPEFAWNLDFLSPFDRRFRCDWSQCHRLHV